MKDVGHDILHTIHQVVTSWGVSGGGNMAENVELMGKADNYSNGFLSLGFIISMLMSLQWQIRDADEEFRGKDFISCIIARVKWQNEKVNLELPLLFLADLLY